MSNIEYGNFEILWRGALRAILEEEGNVQKGGEFPFSVVGEQSNVIATQSSSARALSAESVSDTASQDSPLKHVRKKKCAVRIESDSESGESVVAGAFLDSDSDLEIVEEQWRPADRDECNRHLDTFSSPEEHTSDPVTSHTPADKPFNIFKIPDTPDPNHQVPSLSLDPRHFQHRRRNLRPRSMRTKSQSTNSQLNPQHKTSRMQNRACNDSDLISCSSGERKRHVPVSIEEELIGENVWSSEDEDYEQQVTGALIETEAQCADEEGDDSESDSELEQSFINDQTLMSQQLSQDSMHGLYLQSIRPGW